MKVVIVGGSISGLVHGIMLKHHGHDVHILERVTRDLEAQGAGIGSGVETDEYMHLHDRIKAPSSLPSNGVRVYDPHSNLIEEMKIPMKMCSWDAMYYRLRANFDGLSTKYCSEPPKDEPSDGKAIYDMGKEVTGIEANDPRLPVVIQYKDASTGEALAPLEADLVIAADGAASSIKRMIAPDAPPRNYAGYVAWRGIVPETAVSASTRQTLSDWFTFHVATKEYVVVYPIPGQYGSLEAGSRCLNFVWYSWTSDAELSDILTDTDGHTHRWTVPSGKLRNDVWGKQRQHGYKAFSKEFAEILAVTDKPFVQVVSDCVGPTNPGPAFADGRIILVGDAQTVLRPHTGFALNQTTKHCLELEKRLSVLEASIMGSKEGVQPMASEIAMYNLKVSEFSHVARLRSIFIGLRFMGTTWTVLPALFKWKAAELWLFIKNKFRSITGNQI